MSPETGQPDNESVQAEISAPGGWKARLSGIDATSILIALLFTAGIGLIIWQGERYRVERERDSQAFLEQHKITQRLLSTVTTNQAAIMAEVRKSAESSTQQGDAIVYVLTLDQKKRETLNLSMPPSLRKQINR